MSLVYYGAMLSRYRYKHLTWIDLQSPTHEEVRTLMREFDIHPLIAEELLTPTLKPRAERYDDMLYVILHFPAWKHTHGASRSQEIDFVIGRNVIITTRYDTVDPLHKFSKVFEVNSILDRSDIGNHAGYIFFYMIRKLYRAVEHELEYAETHLAELEGKIFGGREREMVGHLSGISRELLGFSHALSSHRGVLESFEASGRRIFGEDFSYHARALLGEHFRTAKHLEVLRDYLGELRTANDSLLTTKQNEIMKVLTIMAFVTFPLTLISSIFGMNTSYLPIIGQPNDFWIVMGIMLTLAIFFFIFFKFKKWI